MRRKDPIHIGGEWRSVEARSRFKLLVTAIFAVWGIVLVGLLILTLLAVTIGLHMIGKLA